MLQKLSETADDLSLDLLQQGKNAMLTGNHKESLAALLEAFSLNPASRDIQESLIDVLSVTSGYTLPKQVTDALADAAIDNGHDAQALSTLLTSQYEADPSVQAAISFLESVAPGDITAMPEGIDIGSLITNQLFMLVCSKATIISPIIEKLLCVLRSHFLGEWMADASSQSFFLDGYPEALAAIACQCFNGEYIYATSADEIQKIDGLQATIQEDIRGAHPIELAILGSYRPLWETLKSGHPEDLQYLIDQSTRWQGWIRLVWKVQFLAPCQEMFLKQQINRLSPIEDTLSQTVAEQYEAFPYPRWQSTKLATSPISLSRHISARFPHFDASGVTNGPAKILFAGCGTGEQVVQMGSGITSENTLALDLSENSLGYANRKAEAAGLANIHFGQADILAIQNWDASFDLIVCTGVLHHMEDPSAGLNALKSVSNPETLFFLALYSERGRSHVVAARDFIAKHKITDTVAGMRQFREAVRQLPEENPVRKIANSREFYSASGLHDYVFNTHELRFTPLQLKALLDKHDLEFIGFDIARGEFLADYKARFPTDTKLNNLENWDQFEQEVPEVFEGMMQFWCSKRPNVQTQN